VQRRQSFDHSANDNDDARVSMYRDLLERRRAFGDDFSFVYGHAGRIGRDYADEQRTTQ
jgi:hypothetical protein